MWYHATVNPEAIDEALEGIMSLLNPGPYGVAENDPKAVLIRDLGRVTEGLTIPPVVIGGVAVIVNGHARQTVDVDLLVARRDAVPLIRKLESSSEFTKIRVDRFRHVPTGAGLDLCVEGELTTPWHQDRFPSPAEVERLSLLPLPVVALSDLLVLKAKSSRAQDEADFIALYRARNLGPADVESIRAKIEDPRLRECLDRWHARALEEIERDRLRKPPLSSESV